jgi:hypothetical protein
VLTLPSSVRMFVAAEAVDLRRGFDGLAAAARTVIREDPLNGHLSQVGVQPDRPKDSQSAPEVSPMRRLALTMCALVVISMQAMRAQTPVRRAPASQRSTSPDNLPVRRVILYKNGIGYFEHLGKVRGNETVAIDFNTSQLNDVLKTLTVLDLGNGRVTGVSYNSEAPLAQRLGGLRLPVGEHATLAQLLDALRGARLEVHAGERVVYGRLLGVEPRARTRGGETTTTDELTLVGDGGEIRTVEMTPAVTVKLAERESTEQVGAYMGLLASERAQDRRRMTIATAGTGERDLLVSYISEVPIWKTTYRIVLPTRPGPTLLQAWAIVDNTIGEDWQNVELSLVAGAPQSFIQQLSQPLYLQRPVVPLPKSLLLTPQTHQATLQTVTAGLYGKAVDSLACKKSKATMTTQRSRSRTGTRRCRVVAPPGHRRGGSDPLDCAEP